MESFLGRQDTAREVQREASMALAAIVAEDGGWKSARLQESMLSAYSDIPGCSENGSDMEICETGRHSTLRVLRLVLKNIPSHSFN